MCRVGYTSDKTLKEAKVARILESWNLGILESWNLGILESWNRCIDCFGASESWNTQPDVDMCQRCCQELSMCRVGYTSDKTLKEAKVARILESWNLGILESWNLGILESVH